MQWAEQLELQRHQFNILQYEITIASSTKENLIKVCMYEMFIITLYYVTIMHMLV